MAGGRNPVYQKREEEKEGLSKKNHTPGPGAVAGQETALEATGYRGA